MRISDWSSDVCSSDLTSREQTATTQAEVAPKPAAEAAAVVEPAKDKRKLGFKEARELEQLPARIEALETRIAELTAAMNDPAFYQRASAAITAPNAIVPEAQADPQAAYAARENTEGPGRAQGGERMCKTK